MKKIKTYGFIFIIAFSLNAYYSNFGVFPIDTFLHYDSGYKFLNGEIPVRDFWIVHGLTIDLIQGFFFYFFGINWISYILHSSIFNGFIAVFFFNFLKLYKVENNKALIITLTFLTITYSISGTPFLDLHSTFFSLFAFFCFWFFLEKKNYIFFIFIPIFFFLAFFSKPTPSSYLFVIFILIYFYYLWISKDYKSIKYLLIGSLISLFCLIFFLIFYKISFNLFITELFFYPLSIGEERISNFNFRLIKILSNYKFILISNLLTIYLTFCSKSPKIRLIGFSLILISFILIYHQLMTKNQNYIFFLIPLNISFALFADNEKKLNKLLIYVLLIFCILVTTKYHYRFNEGRKFHDLQNTSLNKSLPATMVDKSMYPLKWITMEYEDPITEINLIKNVINILEENKFNKLLITNYLFIDSITKTKVYALSRTYDAISFPGKNNKYYKTYKKFFEDKLKKAKIEKIYIFLSFSGNDELINNYVYEYLDKDCLKEKKDILPELIELTVNQECFK